jgi:hypothetical protein
MNTIRKPLLVFAFVWLLGPIETAEAKIALTCNGEPVRVSLELHYRWQGDGGLGTVRVPELTLGRDFKNCRLADLYQTLVAVSDVVVRHSTGARANTAMIQTRGKKNWHRVNDFSAVVLKDGMRIWMTLFNSPQNKTPPKKARGSDSQYRLAITTRAVDGAVASWRVLLANHTINRVCPLLAISGHPQS